MNKKLISTAYVGIVASLIMFAGDMLLYYTSQPLGTDGNLHIQLMGNYSLARIATGGILGAIATYLYIIGYYHISYAFRKPHGAISQTVIILLSISIIFGGAFHAFFPAFGIVAAQGHPELISNLNDYATYLGIFTFGLSIIAWILIDIAILRKQTQYPRFMILATPIISVWLIFVWQQLPQPFHIILAGGWMNLIMTIFFTISLIVLKRGIKAKKQRK